MAAATTATNIQKEENPRKTLDEQHQSTDPPPTRTTDHTPDTNLSSTLQQQTFVDGTNAPIKDGDESKSAGDSPATGDPPVGSTAASSDADAPVSSIQKKIRRAERFGMPVQLSEEEKRNSRAERFGTAPAAHGSDALKKSEEQKRKARAERFGLVQSVNADEEVKKKARLARFAGVSKTDSQEEDKKKARAIRFSQSSSGSLSEVNGKGNIEPKTAITGKAGGGV